ncbi:VanZ family protein [Streptomyces sp. ISL-1]|uniref:VanZ family protein n=1 Tax=Streptomyces sp. ISL-1 TaxID=2817657 RepID=UPI0035AB84F6
MAVAFVALVAFSAVLARLTLAPSHASADIATANLSPGSSLRQYAEDYTFLAACKQVGGNLLLGVPFGVLLPVFVPRPLRMVRVIALTVVVMALVELAQGAVVEGRAFDVDDVILNTTGALLGYLLLGRRLAHATAIKPVKAEKPAKSEKATRPAKSAKAARSAKAAKATRATRATKSAKATRSAKSGKSAKLANFIKLGRPRVRRRR